jgi:hypothetical protein
VQTGVGAEPYAYTINVDGSYAIACGLTPSFDSGYYYNDITMFQAAVGWVALTSVSSSGQYVPYHWGYQAIVIPDKDASSVLIYNYNSTSASVPTYSSTTTGLGGEYSQGKFYRVWGSPASDIFFDFTWGGRHIDGTGTPVSIDDPTIPVYDNITTKVYLAGSSGFNLLETASTKLSDDSEFLYTMFFPWTIVDAIPELPLVKVKQSIKGSYTAYYYSSVQYKAFDFPGRSAVGYA